MSNISLLSGEHVVLNSNNDTLVLTNKRVRYDFSNWSQSTVVGITLDSVASCGLVTRSNPWLLVLAAITALTALNIGPSPAKFASMLATAVLVGAYFVTRKAVIQVASNGGQEILVPIKGIGREATLKFIEAVEAEKLKLNV